MGRAKATGLFPDKSSAIVAARLQFGSSRINLDPRPVLIELEGKKAAGIGRERHRFAAHDFGENTRDMLRVAGRDRQVMDHAFPSCFVSNK